MQLGSDKTPELNHNSSHSPHTGGDTDLSRANINFTAKGSEPNIVGRPSNEEQTSSQQSDLIAASSLAGGYSARDQRFRLTGEYSPASLARITDEFKQGDLLHPGSFRSCARLFLKNASLTDLVKDLEAHNVVNQGTATVQLALEYYYRNPAGELVVGLGMNGGQRSHGIGTLLETYFDLEKLRQKVITKPNIFPNDLTSYSQLTNLSSEQKVQLLTLFRSTFGEQWTAEALTDLEVKNVPLCVAIDGLGQVAAAAIAEVDELTKTIEFTEWVSVGKGGSGARVLVDLLAELRRTHKDYLVYGEFNVQRATQVALRLGFSPAQQEQEAFCEMIVPHNVKVNGQFTNFSVLIFDESRLDFPRGLYP